jgi:hypothetical protein
MKALGQQMSRLALARLRRLAVRWGGSIRAVDPRNPCTWEKLTGFSEAPFEIGLGINWRQRQVIFEAPVARLPVAAIIHEMGHCFASLKQPDSVEEWDFLGWEIAMARAVGLPMAAWQQGNRDYSVTLDGCYREVGHLTPAELAGVAWERLEAARQSGLVSDAGEPLSCRQIDPDA